MVKNAWNPKQACTVPRNGLELSCSADRSSLTIFQVQLRSVEDFATQYNVHYDKQHAGHLLRAPRLEKCTVAIIFPHNKISQKNHPIAGQCTPEVTGGGDCQWATAQKITDLAEFFRRAY